MTDQQHPITPPPEQLRQWQIQIEYCSTRASREALVAQIFAAGADQELEACFKWTAERTTQWSDGTWPADALRAARRPKPPSLKEQALEALGPEPSPETGPTGDTILNVGAIQRHRLICRALEQLDD